MQKNENKKDGKSYIIGVAGGSCSGKTRCTESIAQHLHEDDVTILSQDSYYFGGSPETNYDVPESIDFPLLISDLKKLIAGEEIDSPIYDFSTHSRKEETKRLKPKRIIIVEGILIFTQEELRNLFNLKVFISSHGELAFCRRLERDVKERGRTQKEVIDRYFRDVLASSKKYVEPSENFCDIVLKNNLQGKFIGLQILLDHLNTVLYN
jgi:uridine kinase